ncbi:MAG: enoyl-CoA hydratase [Gammaproteobacteria bacterium]|jgi:enoyl-CoA hydratase/carnithine racemase|nr:enoyl-CoA hydratase [Gammaproteobacteria bacterium]MBP74619.1 enoyl-CoA hydratase [Gammaproteobacteria bacterium]|tara:strand:+ start:1574 stop:2401 length:828 start_codon:yes stop_codon:yes gene_type:complete
MELKNTEYEVDSQGVAIIWLNRPHRMNAWTGRLHTEYRHLLERANSDTAVRAIVVTGRGRGFCVGGDSEALSGHADRGGYDAGISADIAKPGYGTDEHFDASFAYHFGLDKPVIAAMNGPAAGVGLALACFADLRFAVPDVKFTTAHGKLNLPAEYGLSWMLPKIVGLGRANDLLLTSRVFTSDEALTLGFVNQIFEPAELVAQTVAYAHQLIASVSPNSLRQTRWQIYKDLHRDVASAVIESERLIEDMAMEEDFKEGIAALVEKRPPDWPSIK